LSWRHLRLWPILRHAVLRTAAQDEVVGMFDKRKGLILSRPRSGRVEGWAKGLN
jgi:hypothetical protein